MSDKYACHHCHKEMAPPGGEQNFGDLPKEDCVLVCDKYEDTLLVCDDCYTLLMEQQFNRIGRYKILDVYGVPAILCHACGMMSWNPNDVANKYCAKCKVFHEDAELKAQLWAEL